jgi:hypothetical protein
MHVSHAYTVRKTSKMLTWGSTGQSTKGRGANIKSLVTNDEKKFKIFGPIRK